MDIRITFKSLLALSLLLLLLTLLLFSCTTPSNSLTADTTAQVDIVPPSNVSADTTKYSPDTQPDTSAPEAATTEPLVEPETVTGSETILEWDTTVEAQIPPSPDISYHYLDSILNESVSTNDATVFAAQCASSIDPDYHYVVIDVTIWLEYPTPQPCTCYQSLDENSTKEEIRAVKEAHTAHLQAHHTAYQQSFRDECGLSTASSDYRLSFSNIERHATLFFYSYETFAETLPHLASLTSHSLVSHINIQLRSNPHLETEYP